MRQWIASKNIHLQALNAARELREARQRLFNRLELVIIQPQSSHSATELPLIMRSIQCNIWSLYHPNVGEKVGSVASAVVMKELEGPLSLWRLRGALVLNAIPI